MDKRYKRNPSKKKWIKLKEKYSKTQYIVAMANRDYIGQYLINNKKDYKDTAPLWDEVIEINSKLTPFLPEPPLKFARVTA